MSTLLPLAAAFASIILVGGGLVLVHDVLERRWARARSRTVIGGGGALRAAGSGRYRGDQRAAQRGGQVVWVRAGSGALLGGGERQRPDWSAHEPRRDVVTERRTTRR